MFHFGSLFQNYAAIGALILLISVVVSSFHVNREVKEFILCMIVVLSFFIIFSKTLSLAQAPRVIDHDKEDKIKKVALYFDAHMARGEYEQARSLVTPDSKHAFDQILINLQVDPAYFNYFKKIEFIDDKSLVYIVLPTGQTVVYVVVELADEQLFVDLSASD